MSPIRLREKIKHLLRWPTTYLFGDDIFISYSRADGATYAAGLADWLAGRGFTCRLDLWGTEPGPDMPKSLKRSLRRSVLIVLVGTKGAARSEHVRQEVAEAKRLGRRIVPIVFDGVLLRNGLTCHDGALTRAGEAVGASIVPVDEEEALWAGVIEGLPISCEKFETLKTGDPTSEPGDELPHVVNRIEKNFTFSRKDERQRTATKLIGVLLTLLIGASLVAGYVAAVKGAEAKRRLEEAASAEQRAAAAEGRARGAEQKAKDEEAAARVAQGKAEAAQGLADRKGREAAAATTRANEQTRKAAAAERQRVAAESQAALAQRQADEQQKAAHSNLARTFFTQAQITAKTDYSRALLWAQKAFETVPDGDERRRAYKLRTLNLARSHPRLVVNQGAAAFSPDLSRVVVDLPSGDLGIMDAKTGALLKTLLGCAVQDGRGAFCRDPVFSPDGSLVAADHPILPLDPEADEAPQREGHRLLVWDVGTGEKKFEVSDKRFDTYYSTLSFGFTSDSRSVSIDGDEGHYFWDVERGRERKPIMKGDEVVWSRSGENTPLPLSRGPARSLAIRLSASAEGTVASVLDISKGETEMTMPPAHKIVFMDFTDDGEKIIALTNDREGADKTLRVWDVRRHAAVAVMPYRQPGTVVGISGRGDALFIINEQKNELRATELDGRERWKTYLREYAVGIGTWEPVDHIVVNSSADGRYVVTETRKDGTNEFELRVWHAASGAPAFAPVTLSQDEVVYVSPGAEELGMLRGGGAFLYGLPVAGERDLFPNDAARLKRGERVTSARMIPQAAALLLSSSSNEYVRPGVTRQHPRLQLLDAATGRPRWSADDLWFTDTSPDGKRFLLVRGADASRSSIELRNVSDGGPAVGFRPPEGSFETVVFSPDGARIVTTEKSLDVENDPLKVTQWDATTGGKISECVIEMKRSSIFDTASLSEYSGGLTRHGEFAVVWRDARMFDHKYNHEFTLSDGSDGRTVAQFDFSEPETARLAVGILQVASRVRLLEGGAVAAELHPGVAAVLAPGRGGAEITINGAGAPLHAPIEEDSKNGIFAPIPNDKVVLSSEDKYSILGLSPDGKVVLTSEQSGGLRMWEASTGQPLSETVWHDGPIVYAEFSRGGETITLVTKSGSIRSYFIGRASEGVAPWMKSAGEALTGLTLVGDLDIRQLSQTEHARKLDEFRRVVRATSNHDPEALIFSSGRPPQ